MSKRVIGFMVVGPNEKRLKESLDQFKELCDDAIIVGNNTDERTEKDIKRYDFWFYRDDREWGIHQPSIKTELLRRIGGLNPDIILAKDADELYDKSFTRTEVETFSTLYPACYFYVVNLWNDENHQKKSLGFWNVRMFNWRPDLGLDYVKKNVHCGLGPPWTYNIGAYIPHYIKHYGLMDKGDRMRKVERYNKYDPSARFKSRIYYDTLASDSTGAEFNEVEFIKELRAEYNKTGNQNKRIMIMPQKKFVYVRRNSDGKTLDIPAEHLNDHLKRGFTFIGDVVVTNNEELPIDKKDSFKCIFCGKEYVSAISLKTHKSKTHAN